ncbi:uncharacterized protein LOC113210132 [Frankliniella occidentalis]|uniref:Uncharacterized protein LOC113210132 n=1 Tax=Frankliniella occidentalis TaxID=133901 RepID=A0A6J1SWN3_FRAOC|nr:uncharacterized protein LOC113210132 [Frankliniella occidentalis]
MLDPMLDSDSLGSLVSPARGPPTLFEGDWLGRDSSSLDALPPPGGSRGEGPGNLGLSLKGAAGEAGASVILAPSYRNERTISTFGLASLSALDGGASATSAAVHDQLSAPTTPEQPDTAHSAGVLVRRAPELASLPVLKASSAPAATTSTPTEVADTTAKAAGPYFEAAADWCALADSDTWESDEEAPDVETAAEDLEERDSFPDGHADEAVSLSIFISERRGLAMR